MSDPTHDVTVVGSANLDLVVRVPAIPAPGQTVLASGPQDRRPGGKGLNQAVAAARAGARTAMVLAVGDDDASEVLLDALGGSGVDVSGARRSPGASGTAWITVREDGENAILVHPAANATLTDLADTELAVVAEGAVLVMQLESPFATVHAAAQHARSAGRVVVLNAAPAAPLDDDLLAAVDVLVVNEGEAIEVSGRAEVTDAVEALTARVGTVVVTLGAAGALLADASGTRQVDGVPADVVDTTGAGDTFTGVLAQALADGLDLDAAARRAVVAGALAVEAEGAVPAIPDAARIDARTASLAP